MKQDEFLARLSELVEWEIPKVGPSGNAKPAKRGRKSQEEIEWEENEEEALDLPLQSGPNTTIPPLVTKIKNQCKLCEDCGEICENRIVTKRLLDYPERHWRERCSCGIHKDPNTGTFTLRTNQELQDAFRKYLVSKQNK